MAKFKKLALLCTALMMTATATAIASCGKSDRPDSSTKESSASTPVEESSSEALESSETASSEEAESSDVVSSEEPESSEAASSEEAESSDVVSSEEPESSDVVSSEEPESSDVVSSEEPESSDVVSSEEPEDSSSEEPDVPPVVEGYYVNILNEVPGSLALSGNFADDFGTITFNAPSAGTYAIYAVSDLTDYYESEVQFGPVGATDTMNEYFTRYTFTVDAAGEVTVATYGCSWESEPSTLNFYYFVYKLNSATIEGESGVIEGLATNVRNEIKFNAPAAGTYLIATDKDCNWYNSLTVAQGNDGSSYGSSYSVTVDQAGEVTFYVEYVDLHEEDYDFHYEIITMETPVLVVGENTVTLYNAVSIDASFTPETAGSYVITINAADDLFIVFGDTWETTAVKTCEAGETIILPLLYENYEGEATVDVVITVEAFVEDDPSALQLGDNTFTATEAGTVITFTATEAGTYLISATNEILYADGDEWGEYNKEVYLEAGQSVSYTVKYDGIVTITVETYVAPIVLVEGETTINIVGTGCDILVADPVADGTYILAWDNENVIIYINGAPFVSGSEFDYVWHDYTIYAVTADGADAANVVFTLTNIGGSNPDDPTVPETPSFVLGENAIVVENVWDGVIMSYTSVDGGSFVLKAADGETNGCVDTVTYNPNFGGFMRDYLAIADNAFASYAFTLEAGETITFWVSAWNENADTINLILETAGTQPEEPEVVTVQFSVGMPTYVEIPANGQTIMESYNLVGDYKVEWDPSVTNLVVYYGMQPVANGDIINVASPRLPVQLTLSTSDGSALATRVMVSQYVVSTELILGDNAIDVVDTWAGAKASFTAPKAATYILKAADGETNAVVIIETTSGSETLTLPYEVELAEGEVVAFIVVTANHEADTINLVIEEKVEEPVVPTLPDDTGREKVEITLNVGQMTNTGTTNEYGKVYNLKQGQWFIDNNDGKTMADFQVNALANALVEDGEWIIFYLFNPTATTYQFHLAGGNNGWTDSQFFIDLAPQAWTKVVIPAAEIEMNKEAAWYMYILGGENNGAAQEGWQISSIYAVMAEGWEPAPISNILLDATTQTIEKSCSYGGDIVVTPAVDELVGNVWNITIGNVVEQGFHHAAINTSNHAKVYFYVYNPLNAEMRLTIHGGWTDWGVATIMLTAQNWTKVELDMSVFTSDVAGKIFPIISDPNAASVAGEWKISSFYGLLEGETAPDYKIQHTYALDALKLHNNSIVGDAKNDNTVLYLKNANDEAFPVLDWTTAFVFESGVGFLVNGEAATLIEMKSTADGMYLKFDALNAGDTVTIGGTFTNAAHYATYEIADSKFVWTGEHWELQAVTFNVGKIQYSQGTAQHLYFKPVDESITLPVNSWDTINQFYYVSGHGITLDGEAINMANTVKSPDGSFFVELTSTVSVGSIVKIEGVFRCRNLGIDYVIEESVFVYNGEAWVEYVELPAPTVFEITEIAAANGCTESVVYAYPTVDAKPEANSWDHAFTLVEGNGICLNGTQLTSYVLKQPGDFYIELGTAAVAGDVLTIDGVFFNEALNIQIVFKNSILQYHGETWGAYVEEPTVFEITEIAAANGCTDSVVYAYPTVDAKPEANSWDHAFTLVEGNGICLNGTQLTSYVLKQPGDFYIELGTAAVAGDVLTIDGVFFNEALNIQIVFKNCILQYNGEAWGEYVETPTLTIEEAIALGNTFEHNNYSTEQYQITGTVTGIYNTTYGNFYIVDENNNKLLVYGLYKDSVRFDKLAAEYKPVEGDKVVLFSIVGKYNDNAQLKNAELIELIPGASSEENKAEYEAGPLSVGTTFTGTATEALPQAGSVYTDVVFTWQETHTGNGTVVIENGELKVTDITEDVVITLTAIITCGEYTTDKSFTITVSLPEQGVTSREVVFEFGADDASKTNEGDSKQDGSETSSYTETVDGYTLTLTDMSKVYKNAYDAKGNACLKLGTSKVVGKFSFTVPENVTKVIIKVAGYKSNNGKISINGGTAQTISTKSASGAYTDVEVDTSTNKTVSFTTVSGGYRIKITSITYVVEIAPPTPVEPEADPITINLDVANNVTIGAGTYLTGSVTLDGEYTFAWTNSDNANVTVKVDGVEITNGYKATFEAKTVTVVIESSDNTVDVNVSLTITKTPDVVVPDEEWTKNY